jgi:hypothetical protein
MMNRPSRIVREPVNNPVYIERVNLFNEELSGICNELEIKLIGKGTDECEEIQKRYELLIASKEESFRSDLSKINPRIENAPD